MNTFSIFTISYLLLTVVSMMFSAICFTFAHKSLNTFKQTSHSFLRVCSTVNGVIFPVFQTTLGANLPTFISILFIAAVIFIEVKLCSKDLFEMYSFLVSALVFVTTACYMLVVIVRGLLSYQPYSIPMSFLEESILTTAINLAIATLYLFVFLFAIRNDAMDWYTMLHSSIYGKVLFAYFIIFDISMCITVTLLDPIIYSLDHRNETFKAFMVIMLVVSIALFISSIVIVIVSVSTIKALANNANLSDQLTQERETALHDPLTGVLNRGGFEEKVKLSIESGFNGALFMIDLDNFKSVNDELGHPVGDQLLKETGEILLDTFRSNDFVGRVGGDEFVVFAPGMELTVVRNRAFALNGKFHKYVNCAGKVVEVSASIGVALYPNHGENYSQVYKAADQALYVSKNSGKGTFTVNGD